ncbi:MAG: hypothetical protein QOJ55_2093 [Solirubrobacteraceae bacterium]|nr:hypothetical protein [Solirubrobacteraceae bacterium]MEA2427167.1 hypothetical protein [Thermoleophilaceae bacterium]
MTSERANAYGRVMKTLEDLGPTKLHPAEQDQVREAADALFFCEDMVADPQAREALDGVVELAEQLTESGRWLPETAEQVIRDLEGCGPTFIGARS